MPYSSSLYAKAKMNLVITSSIYNGPIVNFSASFTMTGSFNELSNTWSWGVGSQSIISINQLNAVSSSLTGSEAAAYVAGINQATGFDINNECNNILTGYIASTNISSLFLAYNVGLG